MSSTDDAQAGLYVHVPFCTSICPYCDFAVTIAGEERRAGYLKALDGEVALRAGCGMVFDTVYLGGGTPSSLTAHQLGRMLESVRSELDLTSDVRFFLEANPEDVTAASAAAWRELGFAVVSLGVQSFDDEILTRLGRRHSADDARRALETLRQEGFRTVSADLMYAVAGQTADSWLGQLREAARFGVNHLSCYQLTVHAGTVFGRRLERGELFEMPGDAQAELFLLTHLALADLGYEGYEVSNFAASPEHRSEHNLTYWNHSPYLGLGPSAHSFDGRRRWWNLPTVRLWQRQVGAGRPPEAGAETLSDADLALEAVMLGLRMIDGVDLVELRTRWGVELLADNEATIERMVGAGHAELVDRRLRPTLAGLAIADTLARSLEVTSGRAANSLTAR